MLYTRISFLLVILFFTGITNTQSQDIILDLKDEDSGEPLPFVHIIMEPAHVGLISNAKGKARIAEEVWNANDSIEISAIAYEPLKKDLRSFNTGDSIMVIYLKEAQYMLEEASLKPPSDVKEKELGNGRRGIAGINLKPNPGTEFGVKIELEPGQVAHFNKVKFRVLKREEDTLLLRMNLYNLNEYGDPGELVILKNVIFKVYENESLIERDLSAYGLAIDHDFVVTIQYLPGKGAMTLRPGNSTRAASDVKGKFNKEEVIYGTRSEIFDDSGYFRQSFTSDWFQLKMSGVRFSPCIALDAELYEY